MTSWHVQGLSDESSHHTHAVQVSMHGFPEEPDSVSLHSSLANMPQHVILVLSTIKRQEMLLYHWQIVFCK